MSVVETPFFDVPRDVPPALEYAAELLHNLVDKASQAQQHPHKTLHLTARCIEIFKSVVESFREPPSVFEEVVELLESLEQLELLIPEAITVIQNEATQSTLAWLLGWLHPGHPARERTSEQNTWMSNRRALLDLLTKTHDTRFRPPTNWQEGIEEVKRVDDFLWASLATRILRNTNSDSNGAAQADINISILLDQMNEEDHDHTLTTIMSLIQGNSTGTSLADRLFQDSATGTLSSIDHPGIFHTNARGTVARVPSMGSSIPITATASMQAPNLPSNFLPIPHPIARGGVDTAVTVPRPAPPKTPPGSDGSGSEWFGSR